MNRLVDADLTCMARSVDRSRRFNLLGIPCDAVTVSEARDFATRAVDEGGFHSVLFANAAKVVMAEHDEALREAMLRADFVGVDGQSLVWASRVLAQPVPERVAGIDYMLDLLGVADERAWRVFLLGATDPILDGVEAYCHERHPGMVIAGRRNGYFGADLDDEVVRAIAKSNADVLFVGMPSPRKERWIVEHGPPSGVSLAVAAGGSFDVIAGAVRRAPRLWQRLGLEWLWRVLQEPRRLWKRYLVTNSRFVALVVRARWRALRRR
jgi:N-acetylglucosaminyldiphosphoundecaprenol N-acetyl-beta-D-mannosaminyltransferase